MKSTELRAIIRVMKRLELFFTFILLPLDSAMILLSFTMAYFLRSRIETTPLSPEYGLSAYLVYALITLPIWLLLLLFNGLYSEKKFIGLLLEFYKIFIASTTAAMFLIVIIFLSKSLFFSRLILGFTLAFGILFLFIGRMILKSLRYYLLSKGIGLRNVAVVGDNETARVVFSEMDHKYSSGYKLIGLISEESQSESGMKVIGTLDNLPLLIRKYKIDDLVLTDITISKRKMVEIMRICADNKMSFKYVPDVYSMMSSSFRPGLLGSIPIMESNTIPLDGWGRIMKRIADLFFSIIFLIILSPVFIVIALLIKISSKGPVLYSHDRIGRDEKKFKFYKFRSMYYEKCDWKERGVWTTENDDKTRVTPFGKIIRKSNLDELPQLFNILKGDMSFVGPRPELPKLVEKFEEQIPEYFRRHRVKAGLTGWAQVNGFKGDTSVKDRVNYDIYYIENWSFWFDFKIVIKTIWLVFYEALHGKYEYRSRS